MPKDLAYSFQSEEGREIGLNRRLPRIAQRDVLSTGRFESLFHAPRDKPRVETFAGAACLKQFVAVHTPREMARGPLGAIKKRLARRSLWESKRPGEVWLPSRRWAITHHVDASRFSRTVIAELRSTRKNQ